MKKGKILILSLIVLTISSTITGCKSNKNNKPIDQIQSELTNSKETNEKEENKKEEKDPKEIIEFTFSPTLISQLPDVVDEFEFRLNYDEAKAEGMSYTTDQDGTVHIKITRERLQSKLDVMEEKLYDYASRTYPYLNDYLENELITETGIDYNTDDNPAYITFKVLGEEYKNYLKTKSTTPGYYTVEYFVNYVRCINLLKGGDGIVDVKVQDMKTGEIIEEYITEKEEILIH